MKEKIFRFAGVAALAKALGVPITVFDLETTTFRGRTNFGITEICCFSVSLQGNGAIHAHLINPERSIDYRVAQLTGITDSMVRGKETWGKRYAGLFQTLAADHWVSGFNIKTFDCPAVLDMNERYNQPIETGFARVLDVRQLYLDLEKPKSKKGKLVEIAEFYGVEPQGDLHRAEADVVLTLETLDAMVLGYGVDEIVGILQEVAKSAVAVKAAPCGKAASVPVPAASASAKATASKSGTRNLVEVANNGHFRTLEELAGALGIEAKTASFELGKAVDERLVSPLPFTNETTLEWLRTMLVEVPTDTLAEGKLKPIYAYLTERQPEEISLDYLQLRIGMLDCGLTWSSLQSSRTE